MLLKKIKVELPCDPSVLLLGIYPKESKSSYKKSTYTHMIISALFIIAKLRSQDTLLLMNGFRKCGIYTQWNFT
jgi:hypothetical protein